MPEDPNRSKYMAALARGLAMATQVGVLLTSEVIGGFVLGLLLDRWLHTRIIMTLIFTVLGVVGAFLQIYKLMNQ